MADNPFSSGVSDITGAVSDLFQGFGDEASASADLSKAAAARVGAQADLLKAQGDTLEGQQYGEAATLSDLNAQFTEQSTRIQEAQADRTLFGALGAERSSVAASGFGEGGSAGDILRSSASQGALNRAVLTQQGLITEAGYKEQADSYRTMQQAAGIAVQEDTLAAQEENITAQGYQSAASAANTAATGSFIGGAIKGIAGIASLAAIL